MRDPHVVSLCYRLVTDNTTSFDNPPPVERETDAFRVRLENGVATVEMVEHYSSEQSARGSVEPYFRAWEGDSALRQNGRQEIRFEFEKAEVTDRNPPTVPPPGSPHAVSGRARDVVSPFERAIGSVARSQYPTPPDEFVLSPDVETLWHRYEGFLSGPETLASMGYFCLSVLEWSAGGRQPAGNLYNIDVKVLSTLGYLTSEVGDRQTARKVAQNRQFRPHTSEEKAWIEAAVRALILRVGQYAADPNKSLSKLTMDDLPKLT